MSMLRNHENAGRGVAAKQAPHPAILIRGELGKKIPERPSEKRTRREQKCVTRIGRAGNTIPGLFSNSVVTNCL